jgi:hypothetical protein
MALYDCRVLGLAQNFKEIIFTDEVEARELGPLFLEEAVQCFLALVKLVENCFQCVFDTGNVAKAHDFGVIPNAKGDVSVLFVDSHESSLLLREGTSHENGFEIDPLSLNDVELSQVIVDASNFGFNFLNLSRKALEVP